VAGLEASNACCASKQLTASVKVRQQQQQVLACAAANLHASTAQLIVQRWQQQP
jgi:hypothetical protein